MRTSTTETAHPATYRKHMLSVYVSPTVLTATLTHERDLDQEIKSNSSTNDFRDVRCNDSGFCEDIENVVEPRGAMSLAHLCQIHARYGAQFYA
jgi:hypothetical protein